VGDVGAIVLAAGNSSRLGQPKQLVPFSDGETLVHSAVRAAQEAGCDTGVITGAWHERIAKAVGDLHPRIVRNDQWQRGIGSSIRAGVARFTGYRALVLLACDQPRVDAAVVRALISRFEETGRAIVASRYANTAGIPALFDRSCYPTLQRLPDKSGGKFLIEADPTRVELIDFPAGAFDLDSPADLTTWRDRCSTQTRE
jgi:molybdenum cofactor cytidylyltransferase